MELIKKEDINKKIKQEFQYLFYTEKEGIYVVVVSAKAQSWLQNLKKFISFFNDDNLALKINGISFPKLSGERGEFDGEASWNGNKLKGLRQINCFVVSLKKGEQIFSFIAKGEPFLEFIEIFRIDKNIISLNPSKYVIENGNRRPWFNILNSGVGVITINAVASANIKINEDDDDLQIIINGIREPNNSPKAHQYWHWCGRILKGQVQNFSKTVNIKPGFNYVEFWADKIPEFKELKIRVTMSDRIPTQKESWKDCYKVAEEILNGSISIRSDVTHFHSYTDPEDIKRFETKIVSNAKFLKKIGDIYFYSSPN